MRRSLGRFGVWRTARTLTTTFAQGLEQLGYSAIWIGGSPPAELDIAERILDATDAMVVATGIVNIFTADAATVASSCHRLTDRFGPRFLLGLGVSHRESQGERYARPYSAMQRYLDELSARGVPASDIVLAALGPRMLRLARDRAAGAHPYLTTPQHTRLAREILGADRLLAPEQKVVLDTDPARARELARTRVADRSMRLGNYLRSLRRLGFDDVDLAGRGSDRLIDALVGHGDPRAAATRVGEQLAAGADHVAVQIVDDHTENDPLRAYRALAPALFDEAAGDDG